MGLPHDEGALARRDDIDNREKVLWYCNYPGATLVRAVWRCMTRKKIDHMSTSDHVLYSTVNQYVMLRREQEN